MGKLKRAKDAWKTLGRELLDRTIEPAGHPSFVIYFLVSVVVAGGAGIWLELCTYLVTSFQSPPAQLGPLKTALITFFPAVACSACLQIIWAENNHKAFRAFATMLLVAMTIFALLIGLIPIIPIEDALKFGVYSSLFSLWIWWIANARQKDILDDHDDDDPVGGDPAGNLTGDLAGFKT
jgi:hypothetical protein